MPPCLTRSITGCGWMVKWDNPGRWVALFPTPRCCSYRKESPRATLDYGRQLYFYLSMLSWMLASPLPPSFLDTYCLSTLSLWCKALCIVMSFLLVWSISWSSCLIHFENGHYIRVPHTTNSYWSFTGVWVTASLLTSPGLFSVFWPILTMMDGL